MRDRFRAAGLPSPELDAKLLARAALGIDATALIAREGETLDAEALGQLDALARRRLAGEPVARILGEWEFYGMPFRLGPATLVPRPETERLVDLALDRLGEGAERVAASPDPHPAPPRKGEGVPMPCPPATFPIEGREAQSLGVSAPSSPSPLRGGIEGGGEQRAQSVRSEHAPLAGRGGGTVLDLGTGTGCIALSILVHAPEALAVAVDLSPEALAVARENAERLGVLDRIDFRQGSWFDPVAEGERFDVIVSNPPYIESAVVETLMQEVRDHDPRLALDGGPDGLAPYRHIFSRLREFLAPGGLVAVEIGFDQGKAVQKLAESAGLAAVEVEKDLAGLDRIILGHHP